MNKLGCLEKVNFPLLGVSNVWAKIDTGAFSGAIHCSNIRVIARGAKKERILKYTPLGKAKLAAETNTFSATYVRSATGHRVKRYIIDTTIEIAGNEYPIRIGLSDRDKMKRPVLIGRRFLRDNNIVVDVRINQEYDDEGENTR